MHCLHAILRDRWTRRKVGRVGRRWGRVDVTPARDPRNGMWPRVRGHPPERCHKFAGSLLERYRPRRPLEAAHVWHPQVLLARAGLRHLQRHPGRRAVGLHHQRPALGCQRSDLTPSCLPVWDLERHVIVILGCLVGRGGGLGFRAYVSPTYKQI